MEPIESQEKLFTDTIKQIQLGIKRTASYPVDHPMSNQIIDKSYSTLGNLLKRSNILNIHIRGDSLLVNDIQIESSNAFCRDFLSYLKCRDIESINFYDGLSLKEFMIFLNAMIKSPNTLKENGGVSSILCKYNISTIKLNKLKNNIVTKALKKVGKKQVVNKGLNGSKVFFDDGIKPRKIVKKRLRVPNRKWRNENKNVIINALPESGISNVQKVVKKISNSLNDSSCKISEKITEDITEKPINPNEFENLGDNFQEISAKLTRRARQETHADKYLTTTEALHRVCTSQNRMDCYLIDDTIGHRLYKAEKLSHDQLQRLLAAKNLNGRSLQYNIASLNLVDETVLVQFLALQYKGCETTSLSDIHYLSKNILKTIPLKYIKKYNILPLRSDFGYLHVATMNPNNLEALNDIGFISGYSVVPYLAAEYNLLDCIEKFYNVKTKTPDINSALNGMNYGENFEFVEEEKEEQIELDEITDTDAPVVKLVNLILKEALSKGASDIHIEPFENDLRVRFRIDGTLATSFTPPKKYARVMASRLKIMAKLDISERRLPQDGRFKIKMNGKYIDFRVSTFPGIYGEKVVLRLLDKSNVLLDIKSMGFSSDALDSVLTAMYKSKGMVLVTGPTGSGKTTTLYSMLHVLNDGAMNISTAEDPIEYNFSGINQFQMNSKIGLNFARALRTLLRQDPDIIMVGEMRDLETAETAVRAALTGHLVLSTLHTNNAPETITRLIDMGIEPYLITSCVNLVVAQRLMRKICEKCKVEASPSGLHRKILKNYGLEIGKQKVYVGSGCEDCNNTGYKGRFAIHEVMPLWEEIQAYILEQKSSFELRQKAISLGLVTLQEQGFLKVMEGMTSLDEWMRVVA